LLKLIFILSFSNSSCAIFLFSCSYSLFFMAEKEELIEIDEYGRRRIVTEVQSNVSKHETFYSCVQSACYILCFYGTEMAALQRNSSNTRKRWQRVISCRLIPLKYCLQSVRLEFVRLAQHVDMFDAAGWSSLPSEILDLSEDKENCGTAGSGSSSGSGGVGSSSSNYASSGSGSNSYANPLDSFFPFDPCLLSLMHERIEKGYRTWRGVPGLDLSEDDADVIDIDVDISDIMNSSNISSSSSGPPLVRVSRSHDVNGGNRHGQQQQQQQIGYRSPHIHSSQSKQKRMKGSSTAEKPRREKGTAAGAPGKGNGDADEMGSDNEDEEDNGSDDDEDDDDDADADADSETGEMSAEVSSLVSSMMSASICSSAAHTLGAESTMAMSVGTVMSGGGLSASVSASVTASVARSRTAADRTLSHLSENSWGDDSIHHDGMGQSYRGDRGSLLMNYTPGDKSTGSSNNYNYTNYSNNSNTNGMLFASPSSRLVPNRRLTHTTSAIGFRDLSSLQVHPSATFSATVSAGGGGAGTGIGAALGVGGGQGGAGEGEMMMSPGGDGGGWPVLPSRRPRQFSVGSAGSW
jgi:hypothetical protein